MVASNDFLSLIIEDRCLDLAWNDPQVIEQLRDMVTPYYGSCGAILEVAVAPRDRDGVPLEDYPYFADFESKREIYETVFGNRREALALA